MNNPRQGGGLWYKRPETAVSRVHRNGGRRQGATLTLRMKKGIPANKRGSGSNGGERGKKMNGGESVQCSTHLNGNVFKKPTTIYYVR